METEGVQIEFLDDAIDELAEIAYKVNVETENIGARRLHTIMEKLLEELAFNAPELSGKITIDRNYVRERLEHIVVNQDLSHFIL